MSLLRRDLILSTAMAGLIAAFGLGSGVLVARALGPVGRGQLAAAIAISTLVGTVAVLGVPDAITIHGSGSRRRVRSDFTASVAFVSLIGIAAAAALWILAGHIFSEADSGTVTATRILAIHVPFMGLIAVGLSTLRVDESGALWNALRSLPPATWLVVAFVSWGFRLDAHDVAWLYTVSQAVLAVLICGVAWTYCADMGPRLPSRSLHRRVVALVVLGLPLIVPGILRIVLVKIDQVVMPAVLTSESVGLYAVAVAWSGMVYPATRAIGPVLMPRAARAGGKDRGINPVVRLAVPLALGVSVVAALSAYVAIPVLFGGAFRPATGAAAVLSLGAGFESLSLILGDVAKGVGKARDYTTSQLAGLGLVALLLYPVLGRWGIVGAAWLSVATYFIVWVRLMLRLRAPLNANLRELAWPVKPDLTQVCRATQEWWRR